MVDLLPRKQYRVHYRVLKLYLSIGVQLDYIHNAAKFKQSDFLQPYLNWLKEQRAASTSKADLQWYKLLSNVVYGKSIENLRMRTSFKIVRDHDTAVRYNKKVS